LSINEITEALPIVIGFAQWRLPSGGTTPVFIVSSDTRVGGLRPWNLVEGSLADLVPGAVAIDQSYFDRLGTKGLGAGAESRDQKVEVTVVTKGIRAFTTRPYVFTSLDQARAYVGTPPNKATYFLVRLAPTRTSKASAVDCGQSFPIPKSSGQAAISPLWECARNWTNAILG
jgi:putative ABC transport system permease protein